MDIPLEQAERLFEEAYRFWHYSSRGDDLFLSERSEIRKIARDIFRKDTISTMDRVCTMIFATLARAYVDKKSGLSEVLEVENTTPGAR